MLLSLVALIVGIGLLVKGADLFVDGAARMARGMRVAPMVIGLTVVAFGTSVPELFVCIAAAVSDDTGIVLGSALGSTMVNGLPIIGICALIRPLTVSRGTVWRAIPFGLLATAVLWIMAADTTIDGAFYAAVSRSDGVILLVFFGTFLAFMAAPRTPIDGLPRIVPIPSGKSGSVVIRMLLGFCGLLFGGRMVVDGAAALAASLDIPQRIIGLTIVAWGTSLPEWITSVVAVRRGETEIAVGNVIGSNLTNLLFILGVSAVIRPLPFYPAGHLDMGVAAAAGLMMVVFLFAGRHRVMGRREGVLALLIYGGYLFYLPFTLIVNLKGG